jgi:drug/metabolite transporter (DMT)-like permease
MTRQKAVLLLVLTALCWSLGGIFIKFIQWNPLAIAGLRSAVAAVFMLLIIRKPKFIWTGAQLGTVVAYVATVILFVSATKLTTAANAILLQYTAPIYVALFSSWFLKEKITGFDWGVIAVVIVGMTLFFVDSISGEFMLGNLLAILSAISFAWVTLFMRKQGGRSTMESILLGNIITALMTLPFMFESRPDNRSLVMLLVMGVIQLGVPYILYSIAIKHVTALEAILVPVIEPVLNPIWVALFYGELPSSSAFLGGGIVLAAVTARALRRSKA